jgi:hypothetical protein
MKSAPNVLCSSRCVNRLCVEEDIGDWANSVNKTEYLHHFIYPLAIHMGDMPRLGSVTAILLCQR